MPLIVSVSMGIGFDRDTFHRDVVNRYIFLFGLLFL
jgi:hypothetical protein